MELKGDKQDKSYVVKVKGRMDVVSAPEFERCCIQWIEQGESHFIVDMEELEYISSAGLRSILIVAKKLKSGHGNISFSSLSPVVSRVFSISNFTSMFSVYDSLEKALESI